MTAKELYEHVSVSWAGYGQYNVEINYRGKTYKCHSNNSQAWDYLNWEKGDEPGPYTSKQAYQAFWNECCRVNKIGKFSFLR